MVLSTDFLVYEVSNLGVVCFEKIMTADVLIFNHPPKATLFYTRKIE